MLFYKLSLYLQTRKILEMANHIKGKISQIIGPVIDVVFQEVEELPKIYDALEVVKNNGEKLVLEVEQHIGEDMVRCIAMDATDGLQRGQEVVATGKQITMPVGDGINGRLFNVVGDTIDGITALSKENGYQFTEKLLNLNNFLLQQRFFSQVSKLLTLLSLMLREEKLDCSEVRV